MNWSAELTEGSSWAQITSGATGLNAGTISVTLDANEDTSSRTATIIITSSGTSGSPKEITIVQEAAPGKPDLFINFLTVYTPSLLPGEFFRVEIEKGNQGESASLPGHVKYLLSRDNSISEEDIVLEEGNPDGSWVAGYNQKYDFDDLRIPASIDIGEWYFIVVLDSDNTVEEENEDNNIAVAQFTVNEPGKPDVYINELITAPSVVKPLGALEGHFEFGNLGSVEMPSSHYKYVISENASYSENDYVISTGEMEGMEAGYENPNSSTGDFELPESVVPGTWYLIVLLDSNSEVEEENEDNNIAVVEFTVLIETPFTKSSKSASSDASAEIVIVLFIS
jgi:subtilase family serine protease